MDKSVNKKSFDRNNCAKKPLREKVKRFCTLCRNHNIKVPVTGHKNECSFASCDCILCQLTNHVKIVSLKERKCQREMEKVQKVPPEMKPELCEDVVEMERNNKKETSGAERSTDDTEREAEIINEDLYDGYGFQISQTEIDTFNMFFFEYHEL